MRILYLAKAYPPETGGIETYSEQVASAYARDGHEVTVVTAHPGPAGVETRAGVEVHNVGQGPQPLVFARMLATLWKLRRRPADFVHATSWRVALPPMLLRSGLPLVVTVHGREVFVVPRPFRPVMRHVMRRARLIPTVSQAILDKFQETLPFRLAGAFPNWNGVSFEDAAREMPPKPAGAINIFCMCRLVERKNVDGAIRAVGLLVREGHDITFRIAGSGPERAALEALVAAEGLGDRVELLGWTPDEAVVALYRESHVFLHPQIAVQGGMDMEGFGLSIADAMAFGAVPVAGDSGGPVDFVHPAETGYLVDGRDVAAIAAALRRLIEDRDHLDSLGRSAWRFAHQRLTWSAHVRSILDRLGSSRLPA